MNEGQQTVGAHPRASEIELVRYCNELADVARRLDVVTRMHQSECDYLAQHPPATHETAVAAWRIVNEMLDDAVLKVDQIALHIMEAAVEVTGILRSTASND